MESKLLNSHFLKEVDKYKYDLKKIEKYLKEGADVGCTTGEFGGRSDWDNTALHIAVKKEKLEIIHLLLEHGADINAKNREGYTPIYKIPWKRKEGLVLFQFLQVRGADLHTKTNSKISLVHYSALQDHVPILKLLLENGLDPNQQTDQGETPLHWTINDHCFQSAQFLLNCGVAINTQNQDGRTVLHEAALREYDKLIKLFLEFGADPKLKDNKDNQARDLAKKEKTIRLLDGNISNTEDPKLNYMIEKFLAEQKESFNSIRIEIRKNLQKEFSQINRKNLIQSVTKPLSDLKSKWERLYPDALVIVFEWAGNAQIPFSAYALPRGYTQFEVTPDSIVFRREIDNQDSDQSFEDEDMDDYQDEENPFGDPVFEEYETGIDFSDAFEGIEEILNLTDRNEYWIVKNLYNSFLAFLLKETFSQIFEPDSFWFLFGVEHDQKPFLLFQSD
ncbi:hypothetical protein DLM76_14690 [Leptospira yasudae]|uniref:ankyrin repeat domain-containing protein n=1 Tax=Leptospira yasudae TaxID=2202201 RepID=UPI000E59FA7E|nr:ankyrin repeat domain-containing protein [Leptospira yasudae]RHX93328.1 hypothetical protein DLM76_14690 [Leptospira yasudae]